MAAPMTSSCVSIISQTCSLQPLPVAHRKQLDTGLEGEAIDHA
jgi:hypothetical protein